MPWEREEKHPGGLKGPRERLAAEIPATFHAAAIYGYFLTRASAFGLSPGLGSPGPLGRFVTQDWAHPSR